MTDSIKLMQNIIARYENSQKWVNAPLGQVKSLSNTHIGDIGQDFINEWCKSIGVEWVSSGGRQNAWDARISGTTFEIKTATEDISGNFQFNHVRYHRAYQALLCLGIAPDAVLFDAWRKGDVSEGRAGRLVTMDRGSSATFKLTKRRADLRPITEFCEHIDAIVNAINNG